MRLKGFRSQESEVRTEKASVVFILAPDSSAYAR
jgi:hypothetical protein